MNARFAQFAFTGIAFVAFSISAPAALVPYFNDFEANANGFNVSARELLSVTDTGTTSNLLGRFSNGSATLSLEGLIPGLTYNVGFELYIGATMDGNEGWALITGAGETLVNTSFGNFGNQGYSDTSFGLGATGSFAPKTGADVSGLLVPGDNFDDFTIYYFGKGAGNPSLSFVAPITGIQTLVFLGAGMQPATDEFWALDNVTVAARDVPVVGVPESAERVAWFALPGVLLLAHFWKPSRSAKVA